MHVKTVRNSSKNIFKKACGVLPCKKIHFHLVIIFTLYTCHYWGNNAKIFKNIVCNEPQCWLPSCCRTRENREKGSVPLSWFPHKPTCLRTWKSWQWLQHPNCQISWRKVRYSMFSVLSWELLLLLSLNKTLPISMKYAVIKGAIKKPFPWNSVLQLWKYYPTYRRKHQGKESWTDFL